MQHVDRYNVNTSRSELVHEGECGLMLLGKKSLFILRIILTQVYAVCQIAVFIGVTTIGTYCYL